MIDKIAIKDFPDSPGVYLMKDSRGEVIYVGKALSLKRRLSSYFTAAQCAKTQAMLTNTAEIDFIAIGTEAEALLLEMNLIKKYKPRYNVSLRDDKSYPFIKITRERFPAVFICRQRRKDDAVYLGPFTSAKLLRQALKIARSIFPFRTCVRMPRASCLYYKLNLCPAPCIGRISMRRYQELIRNLRLFLEGRYAEVIRKLSLRMQRLSAQQKFEEAALVRDKINALGAVGPGGKLRSERMRELQLLKELLGLKSYPLRIEAFDISNISHDAAVGSMVSFWEGLPDKVNYRRFKIKRVSGIDDYGMLREIVRRRYERLIKEGREYPDLIIIDGGRGHLNSVRCLLEEMHLKIPVISIAKAEEKVFVEDMKEPLALELNSPAMHLIQRVRNEAHRFALKYHRLLRRKKTLT